MHIYLRKRIYLPQQRLSAWKQSVEISGFGFTRLKPFNTSLEKKNWAGLCDISKKEMADFADLPIAISGSDINEKMITICKANWQRAYLPSLAELFDRSMRLQ